MHMRRESLELVTYIFTHIKCKAVSPQYRFLFQQKQKLLQGQAGSDSAKLVQEFEAVYSNISSASLTSHHEERHSMQVKFMKDVKSFTAIMTAAKKATVVVLDGAVMAWSNGPAPRCKFIH